MNKHGYAISSGHSWKLTIFFGPTKIFLIPSGPITAHGYKKKTFRPYSYILTSLLFMLLPNKAYEVFFTDRQTKQHQTHWGIEASSWSLKTTVIQDRNEVNVKESKMCKTH